MKNKSKLLQESLKKEHEKEDIKGGVTSRSIDLEDNPQQPYKVDGYSDNESMWEFLCSLKPEKVEKGSPKKVGKQPNTNVINK